MTCEKFDPNCEGCRPAILDATTQQVLPKEHPVMVLMNEVWDSATHEEQEAYWKVTVKNSRDSKDLVLASNIIDRFKERAAAN